MDIIHLKSCLCCLTVQNTVGIIIFVQSSCPVALTQMWFQIYLAVTQDHFTWGPQNPNSLVQLTMTRVCVVLIQHTMVHAEKSKHFSSYQWPSTKMGASLLYCASSSEICPVCLTHFKVLYSWMSLCGTVSLFWPLLFLELLCHGWKKPNRSELLGLEEGLGICDAI